MTEPDARYAVQLLDALNGLDEVRQGLADSNWLEFVAIDGDQGGGTHCGISLIPIRLGPQIIAQAEDLIRKELASLHVVPDALPSC